MKKNEEFQTWSREACNGIISHMDNDQSDIKAATVYGKHGLVDMEANTHDLETDGYHVVWGWKVFFEF